MSSSTASLPLCNQGYSGGRGLELETILAELVEGPCVTHVAELIQSSQQKYTHLLKCAGAHSVSMLSLVLPCDHWLDATRRAN